MSQWIRSHDGRIGWTALAAALAISLVTHQAFGAEPPESQAGRAVDLSRLIVVGDSLSAGFQNFSLFDDKETSPDYTGPKPPIGGQRQGFATLIAHQTGNKLVLPLIFYPGLPPALTLVNGAVVPSAPESESGTRENTVQTHNLSVPGFSLADALGYTLTGNQANDALPVSVLAPTLATNPPPRGPVPCGALILPTGKIVLSEVACAVELRPSTLLIELGNNDALQSLTMGLAPTPADQFAANYAIVLSALRTTGATMVAANIPDVSVLPFLIPCSANQTFADTCMDLNGTPSDFLVPNILNPGSTQPYLLRSAALVASAAAAVKQYNKVISTEAALFGATVVDVNGLFTHIAKNGYDVRKDNQVIRLNSGFLGGLFSLDGIHPTNTGYAILANKWISTMNSALKTNIPLVNVNAIAETDPLIIP